ncbi:putative intron-binding protein aquarius [Rosa chinensis]|uniref:Putative intron-binding protein aquarius n=1 Tax=Rosa chinensis TaxID=74649 RepID=A0A2P6S8N3_ROSCH|nr:putative intron-binding protein aquarius [Rosa chinensis]
MTKVYGTGAYDLKRHHVAEYPVELNHQLGDKPVEAKPGAALPSSITLSEIERDQLTMTAAANWSKAGGQVKNGLYLRPLVADVAVVPKCHLSALYIHEKRKLFTQLVDLLHFYEGFEINDNVGKQLTDDEVLQSHYDRVQSFQLLAFKKIPKLQQLALVQLTTEMISVKDWLYFPLKN